LRYRGSDLERGGGEALLRRRGHRIGKRRRSWFCCCWPLEEKKGGGGGELAKHSTTIFLLDPFPSFPSCPLVLNTRDTNSRTEGLRHLHPSSTLLPAPVRLPFSLLRLRSLGSFLLLLLPVVLLPSSPS